MKKSNNKIKNNILKIFVALMLIGVIVLSSLPTELDAEEGYNTNFGWTNTEEVQYEWPLAEGLTKTRDGIGTAGFSYSRFYQNDAGRIVLEFDLSIFPDADNNETSNFRTFRNKWKYANIFIDPKLVSKVDKNESFFMMSYPATTFPSKPKSKLLNNATIVGNLYRVDINDAFPDMPTGSDYMSSKLYLVLNNGVTRNQLNQDYAVELRYTNNQGQIYEQRGSQGKQVLGDYIGYPAVPPKTTYDVSVNNDDVTLKTIAPFKTASMPNAIPNPILPPNMMRTVGQAVIYDNIRGKLHVYYKQAPNHYIRGTYADDGSFLSSKIGIRQVMDARIYNALKADENGVVGQMMMLDMDGGTWAANRPQNIKKDEFSYSPTTDNVGTRSYMMVPQGFATDITEKAIAPTGVNLKNVYLHGYRKEADYVRFIYNVDKNKMDELFETTNSSTLSFSTSYITDRPTETTQTEYRLQANQDIVIPKESTVVFALPKNSRSVFKAGLANNYERIIGNLETKRPNEMNINGVDPSDFGKAYTVTPYFATEGGHVLTMEAGLTIPAGDSISLTMFDSSSPETVTITVVSGTDRTDYTLTKYKVNENKLYTMPNANVRSGMIINRSANTPHVDEFFTDNTTITGHSKYADALVSARIAENLPTEEEVFKEAYSSTTPEPITAEGITYKDENAGYAFTLDIPPEIQLKKDMAIRFSNAASGYFRSVPSTYRAQAKVTFNQNGGTGEAVERIVPINQKAYKDAGYTPNGFEGDNILWLDTYGNVVPADTAVKYLSDYEGLPITDTTSQDYTDRQFYSEIPAREGYTFLGWSTQQVDSMSSTDFASMSEITDVANWDDNTTNYKFTATSPVDQSRTVYAVWERSEIDTYRFVLHDNNGDENDVTHTVEFPVASITGASTGELPVYHKEEGNVLFDKGFVKNNAYFVGWSETEVVDGDTLVHQLYTNGSKVKKVGTDLKLQLNEEPKEPVNHTNEWQDLTSPIVNENGVATIHLYAQYKPLLTMTATKQWYDKEKLAEYENYIKDPETYPSPPEQSNEAHFPNEDVAMVLLRTTEGKTLDPTKYEIVEGFYAQGTEGGWTWVPQEGHDPYGRKYSYLMTEFSAQQPGAHSEQTIIDHFNTHRTWASMYITMVAYSDNLSKYTAMTLKQGEKERLYLAVATSNQPEALSQQLVNDTVPYEFTLMNFEVELLLPVIHRVQTNHQQVVIDAPTDRAKFLYLVLDDTQAPLVPVLFGENDGVWELHHTNNGENFKIEETTTETGKKILTITSKETPLLNFEGRQGQKIYALYTINKDDPHNDLSKYAATEIKLYDSLPALEDVKQEPHIKDASGQITHNVVSAKIPAGSYAGATYTLGYMDNTTFVPVKDANELTFTATPDATEKLTFKVPEGILVDKKQYVISGVDDPADTFAPTIFTASPVTMDLEAPTITAVDFSVQTGDQIGIDEGEVATNDPNATLSFTIKKGGVEMPLPDGITFDPAAGKFVGKTADVLDATQIGDYIITISAEDIYGNVSTANITLTIEQKKTTASITSVTQSVNNVDGHSVLTVEGVKDATITLYSKNKDGTFTAIDVPGVSGSAVTNDGTLTFALPQADVKRFNGGKVYVTQKIAGELESKKVDFEDEDISRKDNHKIATGGAIVIDNDPPTPLQLVRPKAGTNTLKITDISADENASEVKDIDKIILQIGDDLECILERQYNEHGASTGVWKCNDNRTFVEGSEELEVIVNPSTGETATKTVGVLNFTLPGTRKFAEGENITATYYDYLGNGSITVNTSVPTLPAPIAPYDMTAVNDSVAHPQKTVIKGKADPGAVVSVTIAGYPDPFEADVNELGEFTLEIPKQATDAEITVTSKLNGKTADGTVTVQDAQSDTYGPTAIPVEKAFGQPVTALEVIGAVSVPGYPEDTEQPSITLAEDAVLPDGNTAGEYKVKVTVTYPDRSTDSIEVTVKVLAEIIDVTADPTQATPAGYVRVTIDAGTGTKLAAGQAKKIYDVRENFPLAQAHYPSVEVIDGYEEPIKWSVAPGTPMTKAVDIVSTAVKTKPGKTPDNVNYNPATTPINKAFGEAVTEAEVIAAVSVPDYPADATEQPVVTVDYASKLPDGNTAGVYTVAVTVTYPDGSTDSAEVTVKVLAEIIDVTADPTQETPEGYVRVTVNAGEGTKLADGQAKKYYDVKEGSSLTEDHYPTVVLKSGYQDPITWSVAPGTAINQAVDIVAKAVKTSGETPDNEKYEPITTPIIKAFEEAATEAEVLAAVAIVPDYPVPPSEQPVITLAEGAVLPDGNTAGVYPVEVTVTYPDGTTDSAEVIIKVLAEIIDVTADPTQATPEGYVRVTINAGEGTKLATTEPVQVKKYYDVKINSSLADEHYPTVVLKDGYEDPITWSVTAGTPITEAVHIISTAVKNPPGVTPDNEKYEPTTTSIIKAYGNATTANEVIAAVTIVPDYPLPPAAQPDITVDNVVDPNTLPDGDTPGVYQVAVTVTYPDDTTDSATVTVKVLDEVINVTGDPTQATPTGYVRVTINAGEGTKLSAGHEKKIYDIQSGSSLGIAHYPKVVLKDGYEDPITWSVKAGDAITGPGPVHIISTAVKAPPAVTPDNENYTPTAKPIKKAYGDATTAAEVLAAVSIPDYPEGATEPAIALAAGAVLPDGKTAGDYPVAVTIIYPDNTTDSITVTVKVLDKIIDVTADPTQITPAGYVRVTINAGVGTKLAAGQEKKVYDVRENFPLAAENYPKVELKNGYEGAITWSIAPGTVITKAENILSTAEAAPPDNEKYTPTTTPINIAYGQAVTEAEVIGAVSVPGYPAAPAEQPVITVDNVSSLPDGKTAGDYEITVTVTYPDGTTDTVKVLVKIGEKPKETGKSTDPTQPTAPSAIDKVIPVGADIDSPIPEGYIRMYFDPQGDGWLAYNPTFATGTVIAFDVIKDITWGDALANGLEVPTATNVDPAYTFDKWSLVLEEDTLVNNTTYRYYYFVASYKLADKDSTTPAGTTASTTPTKDGTTDPIVKTDESTPPILIAIGFILAGGLLLVIMSKTKKDKEQGQDKDKDQDKE